MSPFFARNKSPFPETSSSHWDGLESQLTSRVPVLDVVVLGLDRFGGKSKVPGLVWPILPEVSQ